MRSAHTRASPVRHFVCQNVHKRNGLPNKAENGRFALFAGAQTRVPSFWARIETQNGEQEMCV